MKQVKASATIIDIPDKESALRRLETAARLCYQSTPREEFADVEKFLRKKILQSGHHSVIEHASASVRFICDRGVTHALVRHRLFSFSQESTIYCNYAAKRFGGEIKVIPPFYWEDSPKLDKGEREYRKRQRGNWELAMLSAESGYLKAIEMGASPQEARTMLPTGMKTEIIITGNFREWRHFFKLRTDPV
ncbi:FAD-dependent thymidylate synthase, partial [Candidatus Pacearchaeota archaeon]|nr:FAD-dependent thymidylate synthase [Candidatus Pacearchaeota archaeon]